MPTLGDLGALDPTIAPYARRQAQTEMREQFRDLLESGTQAPSQAPLLKSTQSSIFQSVPLTSSFTNPITASSAPLSSIRARSLPPGLIALIHSIVSDLETKPGSLLGLNPSRRDAICAHLNRLAGGAGRPNLAAWLQTQRTPHESGALFSYFEEIALMVLGQAILLKRWSDRGLRVFRPEHLGKLNFELSTALRPHVPLHREGFHLTRPNLYSWYCPPANLQEELYRTLEAIDFREESPVFVLELCTDGRRFFPDWPELLGYDPRFYQEASNELLRWCALARTSPSKRKIGFTPTLRLGQITHGNTTEIQWIGCEENTFALLISEMIDLWWGPKAPPIWSNSVSLEAHPKEQLPLVAPGLKPGVLAMLSEMEACDFGWIAEERTQKSNRWKSILDTLPFFKKLRATGTSLGTLQTCVAVTKVRPGGRILWVREEPLTADEGTEALAFILGRAKLLAEIDLSHIEHSLPTRRPLFPRFVYVLERDLNHETRLAHRPVRWMGQGAIKSHVEIPLFLSDVLATVSSVGPLGAEPLTTRTNWKLTSQTSPLPQKEWMIRWPDPSCAKSLANLEALSRGTAPLATLATVRPIYKASTDLKNSIDRAQAALFVEARGELRADGKTEARRLAVKPFRNLTAGIEHTGYAVLLRDEAWVEPIRAFLESDGISQWLEHHAERKGDRWVLSESLLKMLPIPEALSAAIAREAGNPELRSFAAGIAKAPEQIGTMDSLPPELRYIIMSQAMREVEWGLAQVRPFLSAEGAIDWTKLLGLWRTQDSVPMTQHPLVRIVGQIPVNSPITKMDRLKAPQNGLLVMTESGALAKIVFDHRMLADMAWDQSRLHTHPTWGELVQSVRLPRTLELAESAANDILLSYQDLSRKRQIVSVWLSAGLPEA